MNIRIPYEKLGDINSHSFVSFILDKAGKTIFRRDFVQDKDLDFFNRKKPFVVVSDELYEESDSVIFFPFSKKDNKWKPKVVMWKNEDFEIFNGGYHHIRNADTTPDLSKIRLWLEAGRVYNHMCSSVGQKNLIYFTLFGNSEYMTLQKMLLKSLNAQPYQNFDLLFVTDENTKAVICELPELKDKNVFYHIVRSITDPVDASMQKLKIYEWEKIDDYNKILFLDSDIVVIGDMSKIFENSELKDGIIYSATHNRVQSLHTTVYHCLIDYTEDQLSNFSKKNIFAFNAGQFLFNNTNGMRGHFDNINSFVKIWDGRYFYEQSFINYYFNLLEISDTSTLNDQFKFVSINERQTKNTFDENAITVHFMGNAGNGLGKLDFIKKYYSKYI